MSDHVAAAGTVSSPEFPPQEVDSFGREDTTAISVIGKMLVGFFFYSFLIMAGVAVWTLSNGGQRPADKPGAHDAHAEHSKPSEQHNDFDD